MKHLFTFLLALTLASCVPTQTQTPEPETPLDERTEVYDDAVATEEDSPMIVERLLPTGLIEVGDRDAPVTLLMFTEHHCRYCKDFYNDHFTRLHEEFIAAGKLKLQIGILPLRKYTNSTNAATGLLCAAAQGKGIPMHGLLFELGAKNEATLLSEAATIELDQNIFKECIAAPETKELVATAKSLARSLDITLVPTLFLNGEKSVGLPYYADLRGMIKKELNE